VKLKRKLLHYVEIFAAAFGMAAIFNVQNVLAASGLDAAKAAVFALVVAAAKAGLEAVRVALGGAAGRRHGGN